MYTTEIKLHVLQLDKTYQCDEKKDCIDGEDELDCDYSDGIYCADLKDIGKTKVARILSHLKTIKLITSRLSLIELHWCI